ncbi:hypothetical protein TBR22_A43210 [Luteitalea sp. TBR-22]|uniref:response regulator n=1 Tax=Luteitalea sp. TBR-22 TaxID=2802971 RepID=UPI001AFAD0FB|nr:response regulator [Luteitalea sp. TBR-22]BCS35095.1 hypothetical protein TBR22_A43210 [Luteitalea sp. TBR-22]
MTSEPARADLAGAGSPPGAVILVVDDDPGVRDTLSSLLRADGFQVRLAANGDEALAMVDCCRDIALVLTDIVMPEREGLETIRALRTRVDCPRIVAMSGYDVGPYLEIAHLLGADATLAKPVTTDTLRSALAEARLSRGSANLDR